jgi:hypothetical protein
MPVMPKLMPSLAPTTPDADRALTVGLIAWGEAAATAALPKTVASSHERLKKSRRLDSSEACLMDEFLLKATVSEVAGANPTE